MLETILSGINLKKSRKTVRQIPTCNFDTKKAKAILNTLAHLFCLKDNQQRYDTYDKFDREKG